MTDLPRGEPVPPGPEPIPLPPLLVGAEVRLRRPDPGDAAALHPPTHGDAESEAVWTYMGYGPWTDAGAMAAWIAATIPSPDPYWYTVETAGTPVGMAAIMNRDPAHRRAEVGHIWYVPSAQRTVVATEASYLMLRAAFGALHCRRVEWKCDALNDRSRRAALRLGFVFEGVFRNHMVVKGRNRDTAWFAMTLQDWAAARPALERWLYEVPRRARRPIAALESLRDPADGTDGSI